MKKKAACLLCALLMAMAMASPAFAAFNQDVLNGVVVV